MGKQINFYMNNKVENEFINMLIDNGFVFLKANKLNQCIDILPIDLIYHEWRFFIYKKDYGEFFTIKNSDGDICDIDYTYSPVIQYIRTQVKNEQKIITRGRLWITNENLTDKFANKKSWVQDYNMLVRWIKKRVPYQTLSLTSIFSNECIVKKYINDDLVELLNHGFRLQ